MPATPTLSAIRTKVRRITKLINVNQITDAQIDDYIDNFYLYDFPEHLRLSSLRVNYTFNLEPNTDTYDAPVQEYITFHPPVYVAGYQCMFSESRQEFFRIYPIVRTIAQINTGDGTTLAFTATLSATPVLKNQVLINTIDISGNSITLEDDGLGNLIGDGTGTIDYVTGALSYTFNTAPEAGEQINAQTVPYVASRPAAVLFFDNQFQVRPVPDQSYTFSIEAYIRPTTFVDSTSEPLLQEWWQFLAMGAAMKIFEDRGDFQQIASYRPLFDEYRRLAERRTIVQQTSQRAATIYSDQQQWPYGNFYGVF